MNMPLRTTESCGGVAGRTAKVLAIPSKQDRC